MGLFGEIKYSNKNNEHWGHRTYSYILMRTLLAQKTPESKSTPAVAAAEKNHL
jgi:hypothetical protein